MTQRATGYAVAAVVVTATLGAVVLLDIRLDAESEDSGDSLIQRVIAETTRGGLTIEATRELRAGTVSGKHQAWMTVQTALSPAGNFSWQVLDEGGSTRTREKVFHELLKNEADAWRAGPQDTAALSSTNYLFTALPAAQSGITMIRLTPRRADPKLIDGVLTVSADGRPLLLKGRLAKSPSFWVRSVTIVKRYGRFHGIALPTSLESLAEIKVVGRSSLTMSYRYTAINGRSVSSAVASAPLVGPSAEILALHGSAPQQ